MEIITTVKQLDKILENARQKGRSVGFVPTMGALHSGHLSLIKKAKSTNDVVVCSIFINPTQFNNKKDLTKYPRTFDADILLLNSVKCDIVFAPSIKEVYPKNVETALTLDFKGLDSTMEGKFRPGHFAGMAQVVKRLLDIVQPQDLYMGQKDFQQFTIVSFMIKKLKLKTNLKVCKIVREKNGLAMSSRNERLSEDLRNRAKIIYKALQTAYIKRNKHSIKAIEEKAMQQLKQPDFQPEYFKIVDGYTLKPVRDMTKHPFVVACVACWAGDVRLIDNKIFKKEY